MPSWVHILSELWPIAATVTPLIMIAGFYWLRSKFVSLVDHDDLKCKVDAHSDAIASMDSAIKTLLANIDSAPTRMDLLTKLSDLNERMSRAEAENQAVQRQMIAQSQSVERQLSTLNQYLHTLVERGMTR